MRVLELWRYPVKSMGGQRLEAAEIGPAGIVGDRQWGVVDLATATMLTARREPRLLFASAQVNPMGELVVTLPDGTQTGDGEGLSRWLERDVELVERAAVDGGQRYEIATDFEDEANSRWVSWEGPTHSFHDSGRTAVSILASDALGAWDRRRFRGNVIIDGDEPSQLVGSSVRLGSTKLTVSKGIDRCVMVTRPLPASDGHAAAERDLSILRTINSQRQSLMGLGCIVDEPGRVEVGDILGDAHSDA